MNDMNKQDKEMEELFGEELAGLEKVEEKADLVTDVWVRLAETKKPIIMYGMGDGAEKILSVMEEKGIKPADFMASDEFVRGHSFKGFRVKKLSEIEELYDDFLVVICFGSALPEVLGHIDIIRGKYETVAPDVPVIGEGLFCDYMFDHEKEIMETKALFADDISREVFDKLIKYRLSGDIDILRSSETPQDEALDMLGIGDNEIFMDLGAYNGDTVEKFLQLTKKHFQKIYAVEPDQKNFTRLRRRHYHLSAGLFRPINAAVWSEDTTLMFYNKAGRNSSFTESISGKTTGRGYETEAKTVDGILDGKPATLIKYDIEGSEREALIGSAQTIAKYKPRLIVSLYHRTEDLTTLPALVHELNSGYRMYLRHHPYIPAWDTNLYCI